MKTNTRYTGAILALSIGFIWVATPHASAQYVPPTNGLVSWWKAQGNAMDSAGTNDGTLVGTAGFGTGVYDQAFSFDSSATGYVDLGDPASLRLTQAITIDAWINPSSAPLSGAGGPLASIVTKWAQDFTHLDNSDSYALWLIVENGQIQLFSAILQASDEPHIQGGTVPLNAWSHVAMTFDSTTGAYQLYLNGQLVAAMTTVAEPLITGSHKVLIGHEDSYVIRPFAGLIDEVHIYNRALSAAEIQGIFAAGGMGGGGGGGSGLQSIADLMEAVGDYEGLNAGRKKSLVAKLKAAQSSMDRGNNDSAAGQLGALTNELKSLNRTGALDDETFDEWSDFVTALRAALDD